MFCYACGYTELQEVRCKLQCPRCGCINEGCCEGSPPVVLPIEETQEDNED